MPLDGSALAGLFKSNVNSKIGALAGPGPLAQKKPQYFIQFMDALGKGTVAKTTGILEFKGGPVKTPPPAPPYSDVGITFGTDFFKEHLYNNLRAAAIQLGGKTLHSPYPPSSGNTGQFLLAICEGLAVSIETHYKLAKLDSPASSLAPAMIGMGDFYGLDASAIAKEIQSQGPLLKGKFFPMFCLRYAQSYVLAIHTKSTSLVAGKWAPTGIVT